MLDTQQPEKTSNPLKSEEKLGSVTYPREERWKRILTFSEDSDIQYLEAHSTPKLLKEKHEKEKSTNTLTCFTACICHFCRLLFLILLELCSLFLSSRVVREFLVAMGDRVAHTVVVVVVVVF